MIFVTRLPAPLILQQKENLWLQNLQTAIQAFNTIQATSTSTQTQIQKAKHAKEKAEGKYNHPSIKNALIQMFHSKCAYCESPVQVVAYGQIEHFHPKSHPQFISRTFDWNNLLLSCEICNDKGHKGTNFPVDINGNALLINPTNPQMKIATHLRFHWDGVANIASIYGIDEIGMITVNIFDLNGLRGRKELIYERSQYIKKLFVLLKFAQMGDIEAISLLKEACTPNGRYLAFTQIYIAPFITNL